MDFGAGWGRIARFFLREARPQDIVAVDTMSFAIECLRKTGAAFQIVHNPPAPPIPGFQQTFHRSILTRSFRTYQNHIRALGSIIC